MRVPIVFMILAASALAQSVAEPQKSNTEASLRGVSAVSPHVAWASGTHGTYLRTTDGNTWVTAHVPDAAELDFRGVVAFSGDEAFLMSAGPGEQSRIYHTADAGQHWQLQFKNNDPKGFFDSMVFWDKTHGIVLGDPVADPSGKLKFELLATDDGQSWHPLAAENVPPALEGEGAFAASNSCIAILASKGVVALSGLEVSTNGKGTTSSRVTSDEQKNPASAAEASLDPNIWFATGGKVARVFHSSDRGKTWQVIDTPIVHGPESAGIFSIAFRDAMHGAIAGGDYKKPNQDGPNLAFTEDGGKTWKVSPRHPQFYFSAVAYDRKAKGRERIFVVGSDFVLDDQPPVTISKIGPLPDIKLNAVSAYPEGGALFVGPKEGMLTLSPLP